MGTVIIVIMRSTTTLIVTSVVVGDCDNIVVGSMFSFAEDC